MTHDQLASDAVELLPCPFCGGEAEIWKAGEHPTRNAWIACMGRCAVMTKEHPSDDIAIAAWNTRTPPPSTVHNDGWRPIETDRTASDAELNALAAVVRMQAAELDGCVAQFGERTWDYQTAEYQALVSILRSRGWGSSTTGASDV